VIREEGKKEKGAQGEGTEKMFGRYLYKNTKEGEGTYIYMEKDR